MSCQCIECLSIDRGRGARCVSQGDHLALDQRCIGLHETRRPMNLSGGQAIALTEYLEADEMLRRSLLPMTASLLCIRHFEINRDGSFHALAADAALLADSDAFVRGARREAPDFDGFLRCKI